MCARQENVLKYKHPTDGKINNHKLILAAGMVLVVIIIITAVLFLLPRQSNPITSPTPTLTTQPTVTPTLPISPTPTVTPVTDQGYYQLGLTEFNNKQYSPAIDNFKKAIALNPHDPDYYVYETTAYYNLNQKALAIQVATDGLKANPTSDQLKNLLSILQNTNNNPSPGRG